MVLMLLGAGCVLKLGTGLAFIVSVVAAAAMRLRSVLE
jgi:ABC-type nickel/cobalt efflux system permease component RcnA